MTAIVSGGEEGDAWLGWSDYRQPSSDGWVDVAYEVWSGMPRVGYFPQPEVSSLSAMPSDPLSLTKIDMICHAGTHVDAPSHFIMDAPSITDIPMDRFMGDGVLARLEDVGDYGLITPEALAAAAPDLRVEDVLLIDTGWSEKWPSGDYARHPSLSLDAAQWLVDRGVKLVGIDFATPDASTDIRPPGFTWPVHKRLLSHGVLIVEHLRNLSSLRAGRIAFMCLPLAVRGADGAPARAVASSHSEGTAPPAGPNCAAREPLAVRRNAVT